MCKEIKYGYIYIEKKNKYFKKYFPYKIGEGCFLAYLKQKKKLEEGQRAIL